MFTLFFFECRACVVKRSDIELFMPVCGEVKLSTDFECMADVGATTHICAYACVLCVGLCLLLQPLLKQMLICLPSANIQP